MTITQFMARVKRFDALADASIRRQLARCLEPGECLEVHMDFDNALAGRWGLWRTTTAADFIRDWAHFFENERPKRGAKYIGIVYDGGAYLVELKV